jgi:hypothetical protein
MKRYAYDERPAGEFLLLTIMPFVSQTITGKLIRLPCSLNNKCCFTPASFWQCARQYLIPQYNLLLEVLKQALLNKVNWTTVVVDVKRRSECGRF